MPHPAKTLYPFLLSLALFAPSCKKQPVDQLALLPAATQTDANTFGCLVNGAAFVAKNSGFFQRPGFKCQYISTTPFALFNISGGVDGGDGSASSVGISTDSLKISEGETLPLTKIFTPGLAAADYDFDLSSYTTNANATGQLTITHLDSVKQIVSGIFQFNAVGKAGDTVRITNGRFDVHYML